MKRQILFVAYYYAIFLLCLCFCISSVNWCTYVVLISLPPFDILVVYACTYVCILNAMLLSTQFHVRDNKVLTYLLTYLYILGSVERGTWVAM